MDRIEFYREENAFGCFSNFSAHPIELDDQIWPTTEHYFQAQKYAGTPKADQIRLTLTPGQAAKLGRQKDGLLRPDWEQVKEAIMYRAVLAKFEQHAGPRAVLVGTVDAELVEHTRNDVYWADGGDGSGKNRLGVILEQVRRELRCRALRSLWLGLLRVPTTSFVLFEHGTAVLCANADPDLDIADHAATVMREHGQVSIGSAQADFTVSRMHETSSCLVGFEHPDLGVLMLPEELGDLPDVKLGLLARNRRELDAGAIRIRHVEDRRSSIVAQEE